MPPFARVHRVSDPSRTAIHDQKLLDNFESDKNLKTENNQVLKWRVIDLVITSNLAAIYRGQLEAEFGRAEVEELPPFTKGDETCEAAFQRIMKEAEKIVPVEGAARAYGAVADQAAVAAARALPPQLMAAAAASAASSSSSSAAAAASSSSVMTGIHPLPHSSLLLLSPFSTSLPSGHSPLLPLSSLGSPRNSVSPRIQDSSLSF